VKGLVEPEARLEIEATAVIPDWAIDPALFPPIPHKNHQKAV
jgi:hypothetical protein